jgi:hypothetical protein
MDDIPISLKRELNPANVEAVAWSTAGVGWFACCVGRRESHRVSSFSAYYEGAVVERWVVGEDRSSRLNAGKRKFCVEKNDYGLENKNDRAGSLIPSSSDFKAKFVVLRLLSTMCVIAPWIVA